MAEAQSPASTVAFTPESFSEDVTNANDSHVFARLRPANPAACRAYDGTVAAVAKYSELQHMRQFLHAEHNSARARSIFTEDGHSADETEDGSWERQWIGSFIFCLTKLPRRPREGWFLGTQHGQPNGEVDILLAPPGKRWTELRIAGKHARLSFHPELGRIMLEARHSVIVGTNGAEPLSQSKSRILQHGELLSIGNCLYSFEYTDLFTSPAFEDDYTRFMRQFHEPRWSSNSLLSPTSTGKPDRLGDYFCTPRAFDEGTFGRITAGWTQDGTVVAIKHFKHPREAEIRSHKQLMDHVGIHDNILHLLECVAHFDTKVPNAYCVYTPLATVNLESIIVGYQTDDAAKLALLSDFLNGLSYLHDEKLVMHLDIKPSNLAVVSLNSPKGVILDLDSATTALTSVDHHKGTIPYLAPEIIELKDQRNTRLGQEPPPFDKSVDIWALGLSMYALYVGQPWRWRNFVSESLIRAMRLECGRVNKYLHGKFHDSMRSTRVSTSSFDAKFLSWVRLMTEFDARDRVSATRLLRIVSAPAKNRDRGTILLKAGQKRGREE